MTEVLKILVSAGHGEGKAHNRGALCYNEGDNNYFYSLAFKEEMEKYKNAQTDLIRKNIKDNPLVAERSRMGKGYHLYLGFHSNGFADEAVRGTEVFDSIEKPNKLLAQALCDVTANLFQHNNRGVKYREGSVPGYNYYGELRWNGADSAMLVELGFHSNPKDCAFFKNNHKVIAEAQALVIANHYGLELKNQNDIPAWQKKMQEEMMLATSLGITDGTRPNEPATRAEVISMIVRAMGVK